jgi:hypothetical protein
MRSASTFTAGQVAAHAVSGVLLEVVSIFDYEKCPFQVFCLVVVIGQRRQEKPRCSKTGITTISIENPSTCCAFR